ncbi:MAG: hypothetical protein GY832_22360 [Chloroflexi bacterium]|nr:hypothetical protein [Chloroflexota bacterium]
MDYAAGNRVLAETTGDATMHYLYGYDCLGELRDDAWLYYLNDATGYVRQGADEQGEVTSGWLFDPNGVVLEGPEGPVSHLICGGVYDWSTGLIHKGGRYFDPMLGIWLALMPLMVVQSWKGQKKKRRGFPWYVVLVLLVGMSGVLTACGGGGDTPSPTPTCTPLPLPPSPLPTPTPLPEILTPFWKGLGEHAVFVDPPAGSPHPTRPQAQTWSDKEKRLVLNALNTVVEDKFGGLDGFGDPGVALSELGVSVSNPIRLFREPVSSYGDEVAADSARPNITVFDHWFTLGTFRQRATLGHEMTHYWDHAHGYELRTQMLNWITREWGEEATGYAADSGSDGEDLAEAVKIYFWNQYDENRAWTDDWGRGLDRYPWTSGADQLMLDASTNQPSQTGTIQVYDRYDWLQCRFTGNCLKPLTP